MPTVTVPDHGDVEFPDSMSDDQIVAAIKKLPGMTPAPVEPDLKDRLKYAAHKTAGYLPAAGGMAGGVLGAGLGGAIGLPTTGPGAIPIGVAGAGLGAGLGSAGGKSLQHVIDSALGFEETPSIADATKDALKTGAKDAAFTAGGGLVLPTAVAAAKPLAGPMNWLGNVIGRRVLTGGTHQLGVRQPVSGEALDEAFKVGAFKPLGTTQSAADTLAKARKVAGAEDGRLLAAMEGQGVKGPEAEPFAQQLEADAAKKSANSLMSPEPQLFRDAAAELRTKPVDVSGRLNLSAAEDMKRSLQFDAAKEYDKIGRQYTPLGEAKKALAAKMRQAVEGEIDAQKATAPFEADAFIPAKQRFGRIAEAEEAAEEGAARAARRSPIGLYDVMALLSGHAHGGLLQGATALAASKALRTFGPSTATWALKAGSAGLKGIDPAAAVQAGSGLGALFGSDSDPTDLQAVLDALKRRRLAPPDRNE